MSSIVATFILGVIFIIIGISNRMGNISSLHSYHRKRVTEQNRIPFGKMIGLGTIICGCSITVFSIFTAVTYFTNSQIFTIIGSVIMIIGLSVGLAISFNAMIKYNKGIF